MRKSSAFTMAIMLFAFGAIFAAAGTALKPLAHDADVSKELTRMLGYRRDIEKDSRVLIFRRPAGKERLADEGRGLVVTLTPSAGILRRRGGLRMLALRVAQESLGNYPGAALDWVEVEFAWGGDEATRKTLRTLFEARGGRLQGEPNPALPLRYTP